ncbi:Cobalt-zinc-cadmium resistance protein CzcB [Aquisphaera giovannonii]|uniref:Cobalt-zinc-cadmium resistance protein CzcB n=1 Tax=Aquisphaera giovannonii TaxID=406548 RepID=A0A5B9WAA5_9BACT|nr:efflux RND transporter periplasmic adaptor subunit [Aquisphaera giovannonii]QEH37502.1 Cobalt-zinc-cadmium resistance protein CzcB [Aquisphaera giovannonii]
MTTVESQPARAGTPDPSQPAATGADRPGPRRRRPWRRLVLGLAAVLAGAAAFGYYRQKGIPSSRDVGDALAYLERRVGGKASEPPAEPPRPARSASDQAWDGAVTVAPEQGRAIGLQLVAVEPQREPMRLELTGRTAYDPNSLHKLRPRFDTLVEQVHAVPGQVIHKGDPLVELNSVDLAAAKSDLQTKYVQWQRDLRVLKLHEKLVTEGAVSQQTYIDDRNAENKSHLDYVQARDKLRILAVPDEDVDPLTRGLGDMPTGEQDFGTVASKAKMTLKSRVDGIVIQREAVPGNFYDENDILMVIAPLDHLWVLANVYEVDQAKVSVNQEMEIRFPFLQQTTRAKVEYISSEVSRETRAVQVRASIRNPGGLLKSDMLVKVVLDIQPVKGQTIVPRLALVVINGGEYVFVKRPGKEGEPGRYERRKVSVAQENSNFVIIAGGLAAGETVATNGSLILAQLYEDLQIVDTGMPVQ